VSGGGRGSSRTSGVTGYAPRMRSSQLADTGIELTVIGLGGYELEDLETDSEGTAQRVIAAALDAGIDWIDTAEAYFAGGNESLIGHVLGGVSDLKLSTKVAPEPDGSGFRPEQIASACRSSLDRLRADHLDLYFLHWPDETGVPLDETWDAMARLVDDGLVLAIGLSNFTREDLDRCREIRDVDVMQQGLSLVDHLDERDLIRHCGETGTAVVTYEPLGSGILTGAVTRSTDPISVWGEDYVEWGFYQRLFAPGKIERSLAVVDRLREIAERLDITVSQLAIAWNLGQPGVTAAIAGSRNPAHVSENARAAEVELSPADLEELEAVMLLGPAFGES
jgi:aryl-alcohol dehydrogenase-like predicted oxidoreductase